MDPQMTLAELYKQGEALITKEQTEEALKRLEDKRKLEKTFKEVWPEIVKHIPAGLRNHIVASDEDIHQLLFHNASIGFYCQIIDSLPIHLYIDTSQGIVVEYIVPAIVSSKEGFKFARSVGTLEKVWRDYFPIQTDDPGKAVYLATTRYKTLLDLQRSTRLQKPEPEYESIEKTMMVNPSLDDLINLRIEQALRKAMA